MHPRRVTIFAASLVLAIGSIGPALASPSIDLGLTAWDVQASGSGTSNQSGSTSSTIDLQNDLGMQRQWTGGAHFIWRHDLPFVPDLMLAYSHIFNDGDTSLNRSITWNGVTYLTSGKVLSQVELKSGRVVAFWSPLDDPLVNLRVGLEARWLSLQMPLTGTVQQGATTQRETTSVGGVSWVPLGYVGLTIYLPYGVALNGEWSYVRYSGNYLSDYRADVSYAFDSGFVVSAGWRAFALNLDSSYFSVKGDLKFKGAYAGFGYQF